MTFSPWTLNPHPVSSTASKHRFLKFILFLGIAPQLPFPCSLDWPSHICTCISLPTFISSWTQSRKRNILLLCFTFSHHLTEITIVPLILNRAIISACLGFLHWPLAIPEQSPRPARVCWMLSCSRQCLKFHPKSRSDLDEKGGLSGKPILFLVCRRGPEVLYVCTPILYVGKA